ncbi:MAG: crosslink repair DNA glycosylase YcaQ family protein, partial [Solirubrobacteraceae bacterium]
AGVALRDARAGLAAIAPELDQRADGLVDLATRPRAARLPRPRLLGAFEPVLLGWGSRADVLGEHESRVVTGGIFRGFAMVRGHAVGGWRLADGRVQVEPFEALAQSDMEALERDADAVLEFLGLV